MISPGFRRTAQHSMLYALERQEALDEALTEALGEYRWDLDLARRRITFSGEERVLEARADLLASIAAKPATLVWGWSPQLASIVGPDPAAQRLQEHGARHGHAALTADEVEYTVAEDQDKGEAIADLAHDVGRIGLDVFGPGALYYTFPIGGGSRGCVLVRDIPVELPPVRIEAIATLLGRAAGNVDDLAWSFDGIARLLPGWSSPVEQAEDGGRVDVLVDEQGRRLAARTTRDEIGRLTQLKVRIEGDGGDAPDEAPRDPSPASMTAPAPELPPASSATPAPTSRSGGLLARIKGLFGG